MWSGIKNRESLNYMANAKNIYIIENKAKLAPNDRGQNIY
jgi:hypothetical protein